jgi:hypothetical protein
MQGNTGDLMDWGSMMRRAIFDRDLVTNRSGEAVDDPLTQ